MKKKNVITFIALLLVATIGLSACTMLPVQPADATNTSPQSVTAPFRTLSVTGTGKILLVPDLAYINIGVRSEAADVSSALAANNTQATAITDALKAVGIEEKDLQTANFNVYSMQQYDQMGQPSYINYAVENTLYVTVRDLTKLSQVLDTALSAGANQIYGINIDLADRQGPLSQARDLAIKDAQAKALAVAATSGVTLGQIQTINVSNTSYVQPYSPYGMGGGAMDAASSVPVSAGQIVVTFDANLVYVIE
jgi:uncharacterized protein YggE